MYRQLIGFILALSLSTIACRKPCADTDSCLAINIKTQLAKEIVDYKVVSLNKNCAVVKEYRPQQMVKPPLPQVIEIRTDDVNPLPADAKWLRIVAKTETGVSRLRPVDWQINHDSRVHTIEANFSPLETLMGVAQSPLDASKQIQYIPKNNERHEPLLLVRGAMQVHPVWHQKNQQDSMFNLKVPTTTNCQVPSAPPLMDSKPSHVSFSPARPYYSILYEHPELPMNQIMVCQIDTLNHNSIPRMDGNVFDPISRIDWHFHTDLQPGTKSDCIMMGYHGTSGALNWVGCDTLSPLPGPFHSAKTDMYPDFDGTIKHYIYHENKIIELNQIDMSTPATVTPKQPIRFDLKWSADIIIKLSDLNGDQYLDIVAVNKTTKEVSWALASDTDSVLKGRLHWPTGFMMASSFRIEPTDGITDGIRDVSLGDVDGDMTPDLVIAFDHKTAVYWGNGAGFAQDESLDIPDSSQVDTLAVGDLDGDCAAEIAMGGPRMLRIAKAPGPTIGSGR